MIYAAILAGGLGKRIERHSIPKQFITIGGTPIIVLTIREFLKNQRFDRYYIAIHPDWKDYLKEGVRGGHDGMDWLVTQAFLEYVRNDETYPAIDTFDTASWMSITPLSEISIRNHGNYVEIPDFTDGRWLDSMMFQ